MNNNEEVLKIIKDTKVEYDMLLNIITNLSTLDKEDLFYVEVLVNEVMKTKR